MAFLGYTLNGMLSNCAYQTLMYIDCCNEIVMFFANLTYGVLLLDVLSF